MGKTVVFKMTVKGDGRKAVKDVFDRSATPLSWGCLWAIPGGEEFLSCVQSSGDGITVEPDAIIIRGESRWGTPLRLVQMFSAQHPKLVFEIVGWDVLDGLTQRWLFQRGKGSLKDCIEGVCSEAYAAGDRGETVYMRNGVQFLELPSWVAVEDKTLPKAEEDQDKVIKEEAEESVGECGQYANRRNHGV